MMGAEPLQPKKEIFSETNLKLLAAIIAFVAVVTGLFNQHPRLYWFFVAFAGLVLILLVTSWLSPKLKERFALSRDRKFVASELDRLQRLYARLQIFVSSDDARSFRYTIHSATGHQIDVIERIIGSDYITTWIQCYRNHLQVNPRSLLEFLNMGYEFRSIVAAFNRNYVIKAQQGIERTPLPPGQASYWIDQLEAFRAEWADFLRDTEAWAHFVDETAAKRMPEFYRYAQTNPIRIFERVNPFRSRNFIIE